MQVNHEVDLNHWIDLARVDLDRVLLVGSIHGPIFYLFFENWTLNRKNALKSIKLTRRVSLVNELGFNPTMPNPISCAIPLLGKNLTQMFATKQQWQNATIIWNASNTSLSVLMNELEQNKLEFDDVIVDLLFTSLVF